MLLGMSILHNVIGFEPARSKEALEMLLTDRKNEFRELAEPLFALVPESKGPIKNWEEFILNFCFEVDVAFKTWSGEKELIPNSALKALNILRQLSRDKKSMNQVTHLLNIAFNIAEEFKIIYRRIE